jgi:pimeloyl-ACP methyl ester carboxylesterase
MNKATTDISVGGERIPVTVIAPNTDFTGGRIIVFLYGGSPDFVVETALPLLDPLAEQANCGIVTFDYRGTPGTSRPFDETGLHTRIEDARNIVEHVRNKFRPDELIIWGHSMGGYIAAHTVAVNPDRVVLSSPAAYDTKAVSEQINFGPDFSAVLRTRDSWKRSDGPGLLRSFTGRLLVFVMEHDKVVPEEITTWYFEEAKRADKKMVCLPFGHAGTFMDTPEGVAKREALIGQFREWLRA